MFVYEMQGRHTEVWCYTQALLAVKPWSECGCAVNVNGGYSSTSWPKASGCTLGGTCSPLSSWTKFLVYTAYAKVHLLSGQPQNAVSIIDELMQERKGDMDYKLAVDYLQALLIMCHSSLSSAHMTSLHQFLDKGATIVARKSAKSGKQNWKSLKMFVPETPLKPRKPLLQRPACYKYRQSELDARLGELPGRYQLLAFARLKASELLRNCEGFMQGRHWQVVLGTSTAPFCLHFDTAYSYHVHKFVKVCRMIRLVSQTVIHLCWRRAYLHTAWWYRLCLASWQVRRKGSPPKAHQLDIWWCMHAFLWGKWHYASVVSVWFR